jgi:hypothetical protein
MIIRNPIKVTPDCLDFIVPSLMRPDAARQSVNAPDVSGSEPLQLPEVLPGPAR